MKITISNFKGELPVVSTTLLPPSNAQTASDCVLDSGDILPMRANSEEALLALSGGTIDAIYLWRVNNTSYWLRFNDAVDVIRSPIADDTYSRIYWSGDARMSNEVLYSYTPAVYTGGTQYPQNFFKLGIPAPTTAPIAAISGTPPANPDGDVRYYVYTYVGKLGEEGPPSPPSDMLSCSTDGAIVNLSSMVIGSPESTGREIEKIRIYRTVTGSSSSVFLYVAEIAIGSSTYTDSKDATELGGELATGSYDPPRTGMQGLTLTPHGIAFGFIGKILCPSELYLPYAWNRDNEITMSDDIVAVGFYGIHAIVATNGRPVMVTGIDPATLSELELPIVESCVSKKSMVSMGYCAIYASPNGLVMATSSGAKLVTEGVVTKREWDTINPSSIHAYEHRGLYVMFWKVDATHKGGWIFNPRNPSEGFRSTSQWFKAGHRDMLTDSLFLIDDSEQVWKWEGGTAARSSVWRSKLFRQPAPIAFSACRIRADDYSNVTARIYGDGVLYSEKAVKSNKAFRLPPNGKKQEWEIEVESDSRIRSIGLATSVTELQQ